MIRSQRLRIFLGFAVCLLLLAAIVTAVAFAIDRGSKPADREHPRASASLYQPPPRAPRAPRSRPPLPDVSSTTVWAGWALLHLDNGELVAGGEPGPSITASMIKVGIAADFLHGLELKGLDPSESQSDDLGSMIRDSDNDAAERLWLARGGAAVTRRLIAVCELHETTVSTSWGTTQMTPADAARLGGCLAQGKVVSSPWMEWILDRMREVNGAGRFGIVESRPVDRGRPLAIKNGWLTADGLWHVNCLAIADWWTLAVMVRYPAELGLVYGATVCADVAAALAPDDETATAPAS